MGLGLQIIFIFILVIQAIGMLLHRKATVEHILANTDLVETSEKGLEKFYNLFTKTKITEEERILAKPLSMLREYYNIWTLEKWLETFYNFFTKAKITEEERIEKMALSMVRIYNN